MKHVSKEKPIPGQVVLVYKVKDGEMMPTVAAYDESGFYCLQLDEILGCLRKTPIDSDVWQPINIDEIAMREIA